MTYKTRIFAIIAVSAGLLVPAAIPAQAAPSANLVVSGPISQGSNNLVVTTYGMSDAFNDWICRNLGALCR